jgi:hypothetical protein
LYEDVEETAAFAKGCYEGSEVGATYGSYVLEPELGAGIGCGLGGVAATEGVDLVNPEKSGQP